MVNVCVWGWGMLIWLWILLFISALVQVLPIFSCVSCLSFWCHHFTGIIRHKLNGEYCISSLLVLPVTGLLHRLTLSHFPYIIPNRHVSWLHAIAKARNHCHVISNSVTMMTKQHRHQHSSNMHLSTARAVWARWMENEKKIIRNDVRNLDYLRFGSMRRHDEFGWYTIFSWISWMFIRKKWAALGGVCTHCQNNMHFIIEWHTKNLSNKIWQTGLGLGVRERVRVNFALHNQINWE